MALPAAFAPRTWWLFPVVATAFPAILAAVSCSSSTPARVAPSVDASAVCPATPDLTNGQGCAPEGLRCAPEYACGIATAILSCTCAGGIFHCSDGTGMPVDPDAAPPCAVTPFEAGACPATESAAQFAPCSEQGQLCAYRSTCAATFDTCQCFAGRTKTGQFGFRFECSARNCLYTEAGAPAPIEAATAADSGDAIAPHNLDGSSAGDAPIPLDAALRSEASTPDAQLLDATSSDAAD